MALFGDVHGDEAEGHENARAILGSALFGGEACSEEVQAKARAALEAAFFGDESDSAEAKAATNALASSKEPAAADDDFGASADQWNHDETFVADKESNVAGAEAAAGIPPPQPICTRTATELEFMKE